MRTFTRLWIAGVVLVLTACGVSGAPKGAGTLPDTAIPTTGSATTLPPPTVDITSASQTTPIPPNAAGEQSATSGRDTGSGVVNATVGPTATGGNTPPPLKSPATITPEDDGQTVQLAVGESFVLKLGKDFNWDVQLADDHIVSRKIGITMVRGTQGIYEAYAPGRTKLTATGTPNCGAGTPCPELARLFQLTIEIR